MKGKGTIFSRVLKWGSAAVLTAATVAGIAAPNAEAQYYRRYRVAPRRVYVNPYAQYPGYVTSSLVARAQQQGYSDGFARGRYDRATGRRTPNPAGHGAYQYALNGWARELGNPSLYRQYYRQSFAQGYQDGFSGRGY